MGELSDDISLTAGSGKQFSPWSDAAFCETPHVFIVCLGLSTPICRVVMVFSLIEFYSNATADIVTDAQYLEISYRLPEALVWLDYSFEPPWTHAYIILTPLNPTFI